MSQPAPNFSARGERRHNGAGKPRLIRAELVKLRGLVSTYVAPGVAFAFLAASMVLTYTTMGLFEDAGAVSPRLVDFTSSINNLFALALIIPTARLVALEFEGPGQSAFLATPQRWRVMAAKTALMAAFSAIVTAVAAIIAQLTTVAIFGSRIDVDNLALWTLRIICGSTLAVIFVVICTVGVTLLLRSGVGAIVLVYLLLTMTTLVASFLVLSSMRDFILTVAPALFPSVVEGISRFAPSTLVGGEAVTTAHWAWFIGGLIFWPAVALVSGFFRLNKSDIP